MLPVQVAVSRLPWHRGGSGLLHSAHRRGRGPFPCLLASLERPQTRCV